MKNIILPFSVLIIFGIIFFIFYKGLEDSKIYTPDVSKIKEIPVFNTKEFFSGEDVKSSSIFELDKVYLLNIWSSWCVPCRQEHSILIDLANNKIPIFSVKLFYSNDIINSSEIFNLDKFYLLNIWSSWCVPCRQEHPLLMDLAKKKNIKIFGLNYKDKRSNAENFLKELGNPYQQIIFDKEGVNAIELGAYGVPESFLIFKNKIIKKYIGPLNHDSLKQIKKLIK